MILRRNQRGFTLVELMIALAALSTMLLLVTIIMLQLGKLFTKGTNEANTQNIARNVLQELSNQAQFGASVPQLQTINANQGSICIGATRYSYLLHTQSSPTTPHILWRDTMINSGSCSPLNITSGNPPQDAKTNPAVPGVELVQTGMILGNLSMTSNGNLYTFKITLASGGTDLLDSTGITCSGGQGDQYCAASSLQETIARRLAK